jgi:hypothetical protein
MTHRDKVKGKSESRHTVCNGTNIEGRKEYIKALKLLELK